MRIVGSFPHRRLVRGSFPAPHHHDPNKMLPNFAFWVHGWGSSTVKSTGLSFVMLEMPYGFTMTAVFTLVEVERSTHPQAP